MKLPVIKGIEEYKGATVTEAEFVIKNMSNKLENFTIKVDLPDFSTLP